MAVIKASKNEVFPHYVSPGHVMAIGFFAWTGLIAAVGFAFFSEFLTAAILASQAIGFSIVYYIARNIAFSHWQLRKLYSELQPVIKEVLAQAEERERADREIQLVAHNAETPKVKNEC